MVNHETIEPLEDPLADIKAYERDQALRLAQEEEHFARLLEEDKIKTAEQAKVSLDILERRISASELKMNRMYERRSELRKIVAAAPVPEPTPEPTPEPK